MKKNYIIDTSVLLDDPACMEVLRNGEENEIYIPYTVILELNGLKKDKRLYDSISRTIEKMEENDFLHFLPAISKGDKKDFGDLKIIEEVQKSSINDPIIITNDRLFRILCRNHHIKSEQYQESVPYQSESQLYTGFAERQDYPHPNSFYWEEGKPFRNMPDNTTKCICYENKPWGIVPLNIYQNLALDLLCDDNVSLVSIQSKAGYGKSYITLATAMQKTIQEKKYEKIYLIKPTIEIGDSLGFLPGTIEEKIDPYVRYLRNLIYKLHQSRGSKCGRIFLDESNLTKLRLNPDFFEILPIAYMRGMNIDNAFIIIDECQNLSRIETRSVLTRIGSNSKCVALGDVEQIDNRYLNKFNNGLNWIVKCLLGEKHYGHMVLKGEKSRGPVCDMVLRKGL